MGRSRNWHDLGSPISKIRNIQIVDNYVLTEHWEFQRVRITGVPLARCRTSKNATWGQVTYCDLITWPLGSSGRRFLEMCQIVGWTAMANLAALRAAVFSLSAKNLTTTTYVEITPPAGARVMMMMIWALGRIDGKSHFAPITMSASRLKQWVGETI